MKRRRDSVDQRTPVDDGLELRFSAQPGPVFVPGGAYSVPAEAVTGIRQMLTRLVASGQWPQAVALTSALREEGVSYTALALGAVLSLDTATPVCLVDTNWYWPSLAVQDGASLASASPASATPPDPSLTGASIPGAGLAAIMAGQLKLTQALVRIQDSQLVLLPAGHVPQARRAIAARSQELKAVIAELRDRFEYIILDVPAVLATSDAIALAGLADGCCLVVHQGVTPAATVQEALAAIGHLPVTGVILNHVRVHMPAGLAGQLTAPMMNAED